MIYGDSLKACTVGIIIVNAKTVEHFAKEKNLAFDESNAEKMAKSAEFKKFLEADIKQLSTENKLSGLERPRDIYITTEAMSIENNMLTPTFKLKRNVAREYYRKEIDAMYSKQQ